MPWESDTGPFPEDGRPLIEVQALTMAYGERIVQENVTFSVRAGEIFIIMGGSGCGKSTLLRHMIGLVPPAAGTIRYRGRDLWKATASERLGLTTRFGAKPTVSQYITDQQQHQEQQTNTLAQDVTPQTGSHLREEGSLGEVAGVIGVYFRRTDELSLGSMRLYEAPWQKRFRRTAGITAAQDYTGQLFVESEVYQRVDPATLQDAGRPTMPFPGREAWKSKDGASFVCYDSVFYELDANGGRPKPRGENPDETFNLDQLNDPVENKFEDRYPVND